MNRNRKRIVLFVLLLFVLVFAGLACDETTDQSVVTAVELDPGLTNIVVDKRTILLGMQPFPHALSDEAFAQAYEFIRAHSDLLFYHLV